MNQRALSKRQWAAGILLALALAMTSLFTFSPPAAHAAGASAYVKNSSSSTCSVEVRRYDSSAPNNYKSETVKPGKTSTHKGYAAAITNTCKARWSGSTQWTNGSQGIDGGKGVVMAVSQTTTRTITSIKK